MRNLYPSDQPVKSWDRVGQEHALPEDWGVRTQLSVVQVPEDVAPFDPGEVQPATIAPWRLDGQLETAGGGGREIDMAPVLKSMGTSAVPDDWFVAKDVEIPSAADALLAESKNAGLGPLESAIHTVTRMGDQTFRTTKVGDSVVVDTSSGGLVDKDQRYRVGGEVPAQGDAGRLLGEDGVPLRPLGPSVTGAREPGAGTTDPIVFRDPAGNQQPAVPEWKPEPGSRPLPTSTGAVGQTAPAVAGAGGTADTPDPGPADGASGDDVDESEGRRRPRAE